MTSTLARRIETATGMALSVALLGAIGIRLWNAGALWRDECAAVQLARVSTLGIAKDFTHEAFPPPFFILIRLWMTLFGTSDAALRAYGFAVALGLTAALWLVFRLGKLSVPLISLGGIGFSSSFLLWGTSVRGYGIGTVVILIVLAGLMALLRMGTRSAAIIAFGASVLSVQVLVQNTILLLAIAGSAIAVCLAVREWNRALWMTAIAAVSELSFVLYAPSYMRAGEWSVVVESGGPNQSIIQQLGVFLGITSSGFQWAIGLCLLGVLLLAAQQAFARRSENNSAEFQLTFFALLVCVTSIAGSALFFHVLHYTIQPWYLLAPFALCLTGIDLISAQLCQSTVSRLIRAGTAVCLALIFGWLNRSLLIQRQTNADLIAKTLEQRSDPTDLIVVNPWQLGISVQWYYHGNTPWVTLPQIDDHRIHRYDLLKQQMESTHAIADVLQLATNTLRAGHNVWLVGGATFSPRQPLGPLPPAPQSRFGWDNLAYRTSWSEQLADVIQRNALDAKRVPVNDGYVVNPIENVPLIVATGRRD